MSQGDESAFPKAEFVNDPGGIGKGICHEGGLSKREWFAGMVLQGIMSNPVLHAEFWKNYELECQRPASPLKVAEAIERRIAYRACCVADALLEELARAGARKDGP